MVTVFLRELKRRRVLHTASLYVVGGWIALQVVEVLSEAGLPPSTMRHLLIVLSAGFLPALVIGWFFDITSDGISRTDPLQDDEQLPRLKLVDYTLLAGLALVVATDVYILSFPAPQDVQAEASSASQQRTIAVLGFDDLELAEGADPIGEVFAGELRSSLARTAGMRVLGPETSKALGMADENRLTMARELLVTAVLLGEVLLEDGHIQVRTRLVGIPAGNELWSVDVQGPVGDSVRLQQGLARQIISVIAPNLDPDPVQGARVEPGECSEVYDLYLRGKQLSRTPNSVVKGARERGMELLRDAVAIDENCAIAWEAIAVASVDYSMPGFVKAGAAARRALELNESLPEAWTVLAEIAEEEQRWSDSEEYFLRALLSDPTNSHANAKYSEALLARGRVSDALRYILEAYRYEPASGDINWRVSLAAKMIGNAELLFKHNSIAAELWGKPQHPFILDSLAEGHLLQGETELAVEAFVGLGSRITDWFPQCVRARDDPSQAEGVVTAMLETSARITPGEDDPATPGWAEWNLIRCSTWLDQPDIALDLLLAEGVPTETVYFAPFMQDAAVLRQAPRFREQIIESGLLDYWRQWGWSDYCSADEEQEFRCD
jgi:TolB-like protein